MAIISFSNVPKINLHYRQNLKKQQCWCYVKDVCSVGEISPEVSMLNSITTVIPREAVVQWPLIASDERCIKVLWAFSQVKKTNKKNPHKMSRKKKFTYQLLLSSLKMYQIWAFLLPYLSEWMPVGQTKPKPLSMLRERTTIISFHLVIGHLMNF